MDDVLVMPKHARALSYCLPGVRRFCTRHGLSWKQFVKVGLPAHAFEATGDAMAIKLAEYARGQQ